MSKNRRSGLGRGIGALIPTAPEEAGGSPTDIFFGGRGAVGLRPRPIAPAAGHSEPAASERPALPAGDLTTTSTSPLAADDQPGTGDSPTALHNVGTTDQDKAPRDAGAPPGQDATVATGETQDADSTRSADRPSADPEQPPVLVVDLRAMPTPVADEPSTSAPDPATVLEQHTTLLEQHTTVLEQPPAVDSSDQPQGPPSAATDSAADLAPVPGAQLRFLPVTAIRANARQPRTAFDEEALDELAHSIREFGVLQPVVVRPDGDEYELVMGERRLRAAVMAGLESIPAVVRHTEDDAMLRDALLENIHRAQLNPLEEAAAYQQLLQEFGVTHDQLATRLGRSRSQVSNTIRLLNLPVPVQRRVAAGVLSAGHARALLALEDADAQDEVAGRIVAEGLSVRATEELVSLASAGQGGGKPRRRSTRRFVAPAAADLAERLSDAFDTRVRVDIGRRKGRITVEFASIDDLERIVALMAPTVAAEPGPGSPYGRSANPPDHAEPGRAAASIESAWRSESAPPGRTSDDGSSDPAPAGEGADGTAAVRLAAVPPWQPAETSFP